VLSVSSLFLRGVGMYMPVCACKHTHTQTLHLSYTDMSPGVGTKHLESPINPGALDLGICEFECIRSTHVYIYAGRRDEIWTSFGMYFLLQNLDFFWHVFSSAKDVNVIPRSRIQKGFYLHRPSTEGTRLPFEVIKALIIIIKNRQYMTADFKHRPFKYDVESS